MSRTELRDVETIIKSFDELRKMESEYMQKREAVLEKIKQTDLYLFNGVTYCRSGRVANMPAQKSIY